MNDYIVCEKLFESFNFSVPTGIPRYNLQYFKLPILNYEEKMTIINRESLVSNKNMAWLDIYNCSLLKVEKESKVILKYYKE